MFNNINGKNQIIKEIIIALVSKKKGSEIKSCLISQKRIKSWNKFKLYFRKLDLLRN